MGQTEGQSTVNQCCTASQLDGSLLGRQLLTCAFNHYSAAVPGLTINESPSAAILGRWAKPIRSHHLTL